MSLVLTRKQVRDVDRRAIDDYGMLGLVLMENAGRGCVDFMRARGLKGPVAILCGKGNNGGDGFVIARHLENLGIETHVLVFCARGDLQGDALANFEILSRCDVPIEHFAGPMLSDDEQRHIAARLAGAQLVVDALLGTGFSGAPREPLATAITLLNAAPGKKLAIDIPSGLDCDTGEAAEPTVVADYTCTFVARKPGMSTPTGAKHCGVVEVIDIGVPRKLLAEIVAASSAD